MAHVRESCVIHFIFRFFNFNFAAIHDVMSRETEDNSELKELTSLILISSLCGISSIAPVSIISVSFCHAKIVSY